MFNTVFYIILFVSQVSNSHNNSGRIKGGEFAFTKDCPYFAQILSNISISICGGVIIHYRLILTAAHCIKFEKTSYFVKVGSNDLNVGDKYTIESIFFREGDSFYNDLAILKLNYSITLKSKRIAIIALPKNEIKFNNGDEATAYGFGSEEYAHASQTKLQSLKLGLITYESCRQYQFLEKISPEFICAENDFDDSTVCTGDDGGPLIKDDILLGILTKNYMCDPKNKNTNLFVNVYYHMDWIQEFLDAEDKEMYRKEQQEKFNFCQALENGMYDWIHFKWNINIKMCAGRCSINSRAITHMITQKYCNVYPISTTNFITLSYCIQSAVKTIESYRSKNENIIMIIELDYKEYNVVKLIYGKDLLPYFANYRYDIVIVEVSESIALPASFNFFVDFFLDQVFLDKAILIKDFTNTTNGNTSLVNIPVSILQPESCFKSMNSTSRFILTEEMFCIKPVCEKEGALYDLCSEREGAPVFDTNGSLLGLVLWQEKCSTKVSSVVLRLVKFLKIYEENKKKEN